MGDELGEDLRSSCDQLFKTVQFSSDTKIPTCCRPSASPHDGLCLLSIQFITKVWTSHWETHPEPNLNVPEPIRGAEVLKTLVSLLTSCWWRSVCLRLCPLTFGLLARQNKTSLIPSVCFSYNLFWNCHFENTYILYSIHPTHVAAWLGHSKTDQWMWLLWGCNCKS